MRDLGQTGPLGGARLEKRTDKDKDNSQERSQDASQTPYPLIINLLILFCFINKRNYFEINHLIKPRSIATWSI